MRLLEAITATIGALCIVASVTAIDWRLGLAVAGVFLLAASIEHPRTRR